MDAARLAVVESSETESAELDFKASFESAVASSWCELVKDIVAIANSGGGVIVFGVNDDGTPASTNLESVLSIDPATIATRSGGTPVNTMEVVPWYQERGKDTQSSLCPLPR
jgi:Schlafen, AlbA_2